MFGCFNIRMNVKKNCLILPSNLTNSNEQLNFIKYPEVKMNSKQKLTLTIGIILIIAVLGYWYSQGAELFTKTQVLVDKTTELDRMLGVENKQYVDKFVFGLDYAGAISLAIAVISGILIYLFKNKRKETL
jgi:uncharacterized ion transporter superfamily protein YfcC